MTNFCCHMFVRISFLALNFDPRHLPCHSLRNWYEWCSLLSSTHILKILISQSVPFASINIKSFYLYFQCPRRMEQDLKFHQLSYSFFVALTLQLSHQLLKIEFMFMCQFSYKNQKWDYLRNMSLSKFHF